jgi:lipoate synthase
VEANPEVVSQYGNGANAHLTQSAKIRQNLEVLCYLTNKELEEQNLNNAWFSETEEEVIQTLIPPRCNVDIVTIGQYIYNQNIYQ